MGPHHGQVHADVGQVNLFNCPPYSCVQADLPVADRGVPHLHKFESVGIVAVVVIPSGLSFTNASDAFLKSHGIHGWRGFSPQQMPRILRHAA